MQDDSVFADFNLDSNGCLYIVRISFDGYGCCSINSSDTIGRIDKLNSDYLIKQINANYLDNSQASEIISKYLRENKEVLWEDALIEHSLI